MQVAPAELEGLLLSHPDVEDVRSINSRCVRYLHSEQACVVGVKHEMDGEQPKAYIVLSKAARSKVGSDSSKSKAKATEIADFVKVKTIRYKHLTAGVEFIDAVPKNPSGKLLRRILRDKANGKAKL